MVSSHISQRLAVFLCGGECGEFPGYFFSSLSVPPLNEKRFSIGETIWPEKEHFVFFGHFSLSPQ